MRLSAPRSWWMILRQIPSSIPVSACSLKAEINIGDIVVSTDLVHHDMDAVNFGYPLGQIPQMDTFSFKADERLVELAEKACHEVNPEIQVFRGRIVSGDQFIADKAVKNRITRELPGLLHRDGRCSHRSGRLLKRRSLCGTSCHLR